MAALAFVLLFSCEDEGYMSSPDAELKFSTDTITFDTIFTTIGSTTQRFTVRNPYKEPVLISRIHLGKDEMSNFRLNVNGQQGNELFNVEIPGHDSIYIFVEVTIDPNGQNLPMVVQDSIEFIVNNNFQHVKLIAYGQDFNLVKGERLGTVTWTADKPYLVYDYAFVDSSSVLTIEPGAKIYFHKGAGLYVKGTVIANGTLDRPILFTADRLEDSYKHIPDQWNSILLYSGSHDNVFNHVTIQNASIGLQVGTLEHEGYASVKLTNSVIRNMAYAGLFAMKSKIEASNNVIANCGFYATALLVGGEYEFLHTTIANYWGNYGAKTRTTPSLVLSNVLVVTNEQGEEVTYSGDLKKATFGNCIVTGNILKEVEWGDNGDNEFNFLFDHCMLQIPDTTNTSNQAHFNEVWKGTQYDPHFIDPYDNLNYQLDSLSEAIDKGSLLYARRVPVDLLNQDRLSDSAPDLGAYEYIRSEDDE